MKKLSVVFVVFVFVCFVFCLSGYLRSAAEENGAAERTELTKPESPEDWVWADEWSVGEDHHGKH